MTHISQDLPSPSAVGADQQLPLPLPPAAKPKPIPLHAVWLSLSPLQQQRLFQHLVGMCCSLLRLPSQSGKKEGTNESA